MNYISPKNQKAFQFWWKTLDEELSTVINFLSSGLKP